MKKIIFISIFSLVLASCNNSTPANPVSVDTQTSTSSIAESGSTGSGYDDREVQETMKEIDSILSTDATGITDVTGSLKK